jgi:predicted RNase H-like HicB family nuclease
MKKNANKTSKKKVVAVIEKANDGGYGIYVPDVEFLFGYGLTEQEAKQDLMDPLEEKMEDYRERKLNLGILESLNS